MVRFIEDVNRIVEGRFGFGVHDFADFPFFDYYEDSVEVGGHDWKRMVESCAEDFVYEQEQEFGLESGLLC